MRAVGLIGRGVQRSWKLETHIGVRKQGRNHRQLKVINQGRCVPEVDLEAEILTASAALACSRQKAMHLAILSLLGVMLLSIASILLLATGPIESAFLVFLRVSISSTSESSVE